MSTPNYGPRDDAPLGYYRSDISPDFDSLDDYERFYTFYDDEDDD